MFIPDGIFCGTPDLAKRGGQYITIDMARPYMYVGKKVGLKSSCALAFLCSLCLFFHLFNLIMKVW